jgi:hypothetical protein
MEAPLKRLLNEAASQAVFPEHLAACSTQRGDQRLRLSGARATKQRSERTK